MGPQRRYRPDYVAGKIAHLYLNSRLSVCSVVNNLLPHEFYNQPTLTLTRELIGAGLSQKHQGCFCMIVSTGWMESMGSA
jgi:hypothetical protein